MYRESDRATRVAQSGADCWINLEQNPASRPVCSRFLPCLLKSGTLWCMEACSVDEDSKNSERMLIGEARPSQFICCPEL